MIHSVIAAALGLLVFFGLLFVGAGVLVVLWLRRRSAGNPVPVPAPATLTPAGAVSATPPVTHPTLKLIENWLTDLEKRGIEAARQEALAKLGITPPKP